MQRLRARAMLTGDPVRGVAMKKLFFLLLCCFWPCWGLTAAPAPVVLIEIDGAIGPATARYFQLASEEAVARQAGFIVLRLDTPGGLDESMRDIIKRILASPVPVVAWVGPRGARAASAGTYILYASHVAAMSPATNLGAATPISIMPSQPETPVSPAPEKPGVKPAPEKGPTPHSTLEHKVVNDAVAYIRSLAEQRGRNADWAEKAVREAASLSADQALKQGVIELEAASLPELLQKLDGRQVALASGPVVLHSKGVAVQTLPMSWRLRLLSIITNPSVAYLLMLIGIYGLIIEGYSPGAIFPGVLGGICLLLALYALQILPINYAGLALIALGIGLIIAEGMAPSYGVLGIGGVVAFVVGSIMMMDTKVPGFELPLALVGAVATVASAAVLFMVSLLLKARRRQVVSGDAVLLAAEAVALDDFAEEGWVQVLGETWRARSAVAVHKGDVLRVHKVNGLLLSVAPEKRGGRS